MGVYVNMYLENCKTKEKVLMDYWSWCIDITSLSMYISDTITNMGSGVDNGKGEYVMDAYLNTADIDKIISQYDVDIIQKQNNLDKILIGGAGAKPTKIYKLQNDIKADKIFCRDMVKLRAKIDFINEMYSVISDINGEWNIVFTIN